jgi:hypothetical protein
MNRSEHLEWCKKRALEYCDRGDAENALFSMLSDLGEHPEAHNDGISDKQRDMLKLIRRSHCSEDGWRQVSGYLWKLVVDYSHPELTELCHEKKRVRLTQQGTTVLRFLP